jgi:hypothetical protein
MHPDWCITEPGTGIAVKDGIGYPARAFGEGGVGSVEDFIKGFKGVAICLYNHGTICGDPDCHTTKGQPYPAQVAACGQVRFCMPLAMGAEVPMVDGCTYITAHVPEVPPEPCLEGRVADCIWEITDDPAKALGKIKDTNVDCFDCIDGKYVAAEANPYVVAYVGDDIK